MTHYFDLWHLKTVKTAIFITQWWQLMELLAFDGGVITLAGSRLRIKNLEHNFG
jgi:hypothetical protein